MAQVDTLKQIKQMKRLTNSKTHTTMNKLSHQTTIHKPNQMDFLLPLSTQTSQTHLLQHQITTAKGQQRNKASEPAPEPPQY